MAYELFEELSAYSLDEIDEDDLRQIVNDIHHELTRRYRIEINKTIEEFKIIFEKLLKLNVTVFVKAEVEDDEGNIIHDDFYIDTIDDFDFDY